MANLWILLCEIENPTDGNWELAGERSADARALRSRLTEIGGLIGLVDATAETFLNGGLIPRLGLKALVNRARRSHRSSKRTRSKR